MAVQQGNLSVEIVGRFLSKAPVDLKAMGQALGLQIETCWFDDPDVAGKIERSGRDYTVSINALDNPRRQRFTLAHEIAHYVLHRDLIGDGITDRGLYRSRLSDALETQANRYAANLLMPGPLVRAAWRDGEKSLSGIAKLFNVSAEAARIRLQELGLGA